MAKYDLETLMTDIKSCYQANMPAKIAELNTEKNDAISLSVPADGSYVMQSMDGASANWNPFMFIGIVDLVGEPTTGYSDMKPSVAVLAVIEDDGQDVEIWKRLFRYHRAIREIAESNFDFLPGHSTLGIKSQVPVELALVNGSFRHKAMGVLLEAHLG